MRWKHTEFVVLHLQEVRFSQYVQIDLWNEIEENDDIEIQLGVL